MKDPLSGALAAVTAGPKLAQVDDGADLVLIRRGVLAAAAYSLRKSGDAPNTLAAIRAVYLAKAKPADAWRVDLEDSAYVVLDADDAQLMDDCTNHGATVTPLYAGQPPTVTPPRATLATAPGCLNTNDKAMWVTGWNECLDKLGKP